MPVDLSVLARKSSTVPSGHDTGPSGHSKHLPKSSWCFSARASSWNAILRDAFSSNCFFLLPDSLTRFAVDLNVSNFNFYIKAWNSSVLSIILNFINVSYSVFPASSAPRTSDSIRAFTAAPKAKQNKFSFLSISNGLINPSIAFRTSWTAFSLLTIYEALVSLC